MQYFLGGGQIKWKNAFLSIKVYVKNGIFDSVCVICDFAHPDHF